MLPFVVSKRKQDSKFKFAAISINKLQQDSEKSNNRSGRRKIFSQINLLYFFKSLLLSSLHKATWTSQPSWVWRPWRQSFQSDLLIDVPQAPRTAYVVGTQQMFGQWMGVPIVAQWLTNPTSIRKGTGRVPGITQWVKQPALSWTVE